jgi:hypothetical protein
MFALLVTVICIEKDGRKLQDVNRVPKFYIIHTFYMTVFRFTIYCKITVHIIIHYLQS